MRRIGVVKSAMTDASRTDWPRIESEILLDPEWRKGLQQLGDYSHVMVLWWMHEIDFCKLVHVPQGRYADIPAVGIFASRCGYRPNPIGATTVEIVEVGVGSVRVRGLDAIDGTPVLDLKPHLPQLVPDGAAVRMPSWCSLIY